MWRLLKYGQVYYGDDRWVSSIYTVINYLSKYFEEILGKNVALVIPKYWEAINTASVSDAQRSTREGP